MYRSEVRPEILQAFIDYGDIMTKEDFQLIFFTTDNEILLLEQSNVNSFASESDLEEYKSISSHEDLLDDNTWWDIRNDLI